jgi:glycosyltransferase involved in cell wall biosynthesis
MKILYLCSDAGIPVLGRKGASVHVRQLIASFARAGHRVVLAAPSLTKSPWDEPAEVAAEVIHCRLSSSAQDAVNEVKEYAGELGGANSLASELRRILASQELAANLLPRFKGDAPDFIYERASLFGTAGVSLAPLVEEQSLYRGAGLGALALEAEKHTLTKADAVFTVSAPLRDHVLALGAEAERVHVLPNGVDPELFRPASRDEALRAKLGLGSGPVLGFLGGLRPWHGVEILPDLLARLSAKHPGAQLLFAGDGQLRGELERRLGELGLSHRAVFTGNLPHEQVPAVVRLFDVALAPYPELDHAFYFSPLKVFEYMACGTAVVASSCGQISEVVRDGENGLLVPPGDLDALTRACDRLLTDSSLRVRLGQAASELIRRKFTWNENAARVEALARQLLDQRPSRVSQRMTSELATITKP